jgi:2-polyprenyl-3-methyl-5-hydroxy-6-metoxy-1,4-benzoquinol methylase
MSERELRRFAYENPRPDVQSLVPPGAERILDLGCSSGALGAALRARQGAEVIGIERDPELAADAEGRLDRVIVADIEELFGSEDGSEIGPVDCLIAADVLEHLADPWTVLGNAARLVKPGGTVVISLPNVRFWETFRAVGLRGTWPRRQLGIFDRTHLRWFTLADALELLRQAGLSPAQVSPQYRLHPNRDEVSQFAKRLMAATRLRPLFAFQYVIAARREG